MKRELYEYEVFPKILPSDKESRITLRSLAYHTAFKKEEKYTLRVLPLCQSHDPQKDDTYPSYTARVQADGTLCLTHCFCGEQEHCIRILREDGTKLVDLSVYSVLSDLYALRPYLGDMHSHTCFSDGKEAPEFVAARYREEGFDFLAITDHRRYEPSLRAIDFYKDVNIDLCLVPGEEI
ncbi:MAG: PHP domain-containing protein, partial [Oscillospiraceae bacterium]